MPDEIQIEAMTSAHYDDVVALWQLTDGLGQVESRDEFNAYLARNPGISSIAILNADVVGAVLGGHDGKRAFLYHLAVSSAHRAQGIANKLIARCLDELQRVSIPRCSVHVYIANISACDFWVHANWRERTDLKVYAMDLPRNE